MAWWGVTVSSINDRLKMIAATTAWTDVDIESCLDFAEVNLKARFHANFSQFFDIWDAGSAPDAMQEMYRQVAICELLQRIHDRNSMLIGSEDLKKRMRERDRMASRIQMGRVSWDSYGADLRKIGSARIER